MGLLRRLRYQTLNMNMTMTTKERKIPWTNDIDLDTQALRLSDTDLQGEGEIAMSATSNKHQATECLYQQDTKNMSCLYRFVPNEMVGNRGCVSPPLDNGRKIKDVLDLSLQQAIAQISEYEANDSEWPYNRSPEHTDQEWWHLRLVKIFGVLCGSK